MSKVELITQNLGEHLLEQIKTASTICILTSFVMKSGVDFLKEALKTAAERGADIKICTGDYLFITQPEALNELLMINPAIEVRLWVSNGISFHPKAYLFQTEDKECLFIGSSNLSRSALTQGVEWNLSVSENKTVYKQALDHFLKIYLAEETIWLNRETVKDYREKYQVYHQKHPHLATEWSKLEELDLMLPTKLNPKQPSQVLDPPVTYDDIKPRFAQLEALDELNKTIEEDYDKALVVMATGLGKTYLAGFFAQMFKRVLFVAHREEILNQAQESFRNIMPERSTGIYNGNHKDSNVDSIFASINTLSMKAHIQKFRKDEFDIIIIDEFHHAAANMYKRVLEYFKPKFLLGITATPDRNDNKDVYAICDGNVAFRLDFLDAIEKKWLSPFKYFGVYDDTDYSQITWFGTRYDEEELLQAQLREGLAEKILQAWVEKKQTRTIGFCSSIKQANYLSGYFNENGYRTVGLHSQQIGISRKSAIEQLNNGELDVIFTVDLFNEGVDIPSVDTLLFVRPTESLTVFTQQIGRGLRIYPGKEYCVIIDLIGNYRNADIKLGLFDTQSGEKKGKQTHPVVPEYCELNLDLEVINLFKEMNRKTQPRRDRLLNDYHTLKNELGRRPTYLDLHLRGESDSIQYKQEFQSYFGFLDWAGELSDTENEIWKRYQDWLIDVEKTGMTKSYKMIVLMAMLNRGPANWYAPITPREVAPFFYQYLMKKEYRKRIDFSDKSSKELWQYNQDKVSKLIATMPMSKWNGSSKQLTTFENNLFSLNFNVLPEDEEILHNWTKEICEYRLHYHFERKAK
ncbi:DEAD/DEAH box helicase family protein [Pseudoneobacillus sp. C159]